MQTNHAAPGRGNRRKHTGHPHLSPKEQERNDQRASSETDQEFPRNEATHWRQKAQAGAHKRQ